MSRAHVDTDQVAERLRESQQKLSETLSGESASQQVMSGFAEAYRAWLEAMSAKPETMLDLQGKYMQEQMKLWIGALQGTPGGEAPPDPAPDKRFSAPEWNALFDACASLPPAYRIEMAVLARRRGGLDGGRRDEILALAKADAIWSHRLPEL